MVRLTDRDLQAVMQRIADSVQTKLEAEDRDDVAIEKVVNGFAFTQHNHTVLLFDDPHFSGRLGVKAGKGIPIAVDPNRQFGDDVIDRMAEHIITAFADPYLWMD